MPIKNYTTTISAMKSIGEIQGNLAAHGASAIMVRYNEFKEPESLSFVIHTHQGDIPFCLPANIQALKIVLEKQHAHRGTPINIAWRIIKDWVDAQLAIIETEMVTIEQVFLPYMQVKNGQTLYEVMQERKFLLTEGQGR